MHLQPSLPCRTSYHNLLRPTLDCSYWIVHGRDTDVFTDKAHLYFVIEVIHIEKPTLPALSCLSIRDGENIRVIEESANKYHCIGLILLNDSYGDRVEIIENDMRGKRSILFKKSTRSG